MAATTGGRKAELRARLARARATFLEAARALTPEELQCSIGHESDWTARDLIGHVAYAEGGMLPMIERPLAGKSHQIPPDFDLDRWNDSRVRRAREQSVDELLARLEESRQQALALLDALNEVDLDRPSSHPAMRETTVGGIFTIIARHEHGHAQELRAIHGELAGAPVS